MGIGLGLVLLLVGLVLVFDVVDVGTQHVDEGPLGWILLVIGGLATVLALVMNRQRAATRHLETRVEERRDLQG
ncbi:MAG: DUF6458 family protein [Nocardioides sp.]